MQLTLQMMDGRQYPFEISDGPDESDFFGSIRCWEVFDGSILRIHDGKDTWAFNPQRIEKIRFQTALDPGWQPPENILSTKSISHDSYLKKAKIYGERPRPTDQAFEEGKPFESVLTLTLSSGSVEYLDMYLMLRQRRERMANMARLFQKLNYPIACDSGGFILLNPRHIVCIHIHPGVPEDRASAWRVNSFAGLTEAGTTSAGII